jgi:hypothetical protein
LTKAKANLESSRIASLQSAMARLGAPFGPIGVTAVVEGRDVFRFYPDRLIVVGDGANAELGF